MTTRIKGFWVALDNDIREDDVQPLIEAVKQLRDVQAVSVCESNSDDWMARTRVRAELGEKLWEVLYPKEEKRG